MPTRSPQRAANLTRGCQHRPKTPVCDPRARTSPLAHRGGLDVGKAASRLPSKSSCSGLQRSTPGENGWPRACVPAPTSYWPGTRDTQGARAEAAIDALWPDASSQRGRERFWTALGNLRSRLRGPARGTEILVKVGEHYRPDPTVLDIDLWRFESALVDAAEASEPGDVVAALRSASAAYGGDFSPSDGLWVEPVREDLHRRALDVHIRLAELETEAGRSEAALAALERSIEIDPICEDAYRRLITLQTDLGRPDAAQRTWVLPAGPLGRARPRTRSGDEQARPRGALTPTDSRRSGARPGRR